ncbi:MAG: phosphomethylpyrimidine synthase ThiC [Promethearchaeota archaeon]
MTLQNRKIAKKLSEELISVAKEERIDLKNLEKNVNSGKAVILKRKGHKPVGIGFGLRTKINVNLGTSSSVHDVDQELEKVKIAQKYGADTISDLSMGGNIDEIRQKILKNSNIPITTVPIYQAVVEEGSLEYVSEDAILGVIEKHIKDNVSSIVLHAGFNLDDIQKMKGKRIMGMVSKGGSFTASIMSDSGSNNPFYTNFDYILDLMKSNDTVLNLGNSMRSGCVHDRIDELQFSEMLTNSKLAKRANEQGVQVILESLGGHINVKELIEWIQIHKQITNDRPLFVSGPLPTDIGIGYDHISASIGAAFASGHGADYLCTITPAEHLGLPDIEDIKNGLIACKLAAHIGDSMKFGLNYLFEVDLNIARNRFQRNWKGQFELSLDPDYLRCKYPEQKKDCSMCGKYCALSTSKRIFDKKP